MAGALPFRLLLRTEGPESDSDGGELDGGQDGGSRVDIDGSTIMNDGSNGGSDGVGGVTGATGVVGAGGGGGVGGAYLYAGSSPLNQGTKV